MMPACLHQALHWVPFKVLRTQSGSTPVVSGSLLDMLLRQTITRYRQLTTWAPLFVGVVTTGLLFCIALWITTNAQWSSIEQAQIHGTEMVKVIRDEANALVDRVTKEIPPDCTDASLTRLRKLILFNRSVGDVGVLDAEGNVACTTTLNRLAPPIQSPSNGVAYRSWAGVQSRLYVDVPIAAGDSHLRGVVLYVGRFNFVIAPMAIQEVLARGATALQLRAADAPVLTISQSTLTTPEWASRLRSSAYASGIGSRFDWATTSFVQTSRPPNSVFVVQTVVGLKFFLKTYGAYLALAGVGSLLVGGLSFYSARNALAKLGSMEFRVPYLLTDDCIVCNYQPIVDLSTGAICGCEVLVRFRDGNEIIFPDKVLPAVEKKHLTWRLDQTVVKKAACELNQHLPEVPHIKVSFNVYPENIKHATLAPLVKSLLSQTSGRRTFGVEVLEASYDQSIATETTLLRKEGLMISVDDFGTGYSNLRSVKELAPDLLKIDRSFVKDMEAQSVRSSLIPEILNIARAVNAKVVAEGVENELQLEMLRSMGIEYAQGYLLGKPMPIEQFAELLRKEGNVEAHAA